MSAGNRQQIRVTVLDSAGRVIDGPCRSFFGDDELLGAIVRDSTDVKDETDVEARMELQRAIQRAMDPLLWC